MALLRGILTRLRSLQAPSVDDAVAVLKKPLSYLAAFDLPLIGHDELGALTSLPLYGGVALW